ncbi:hypothetical protein LTR36_001373 [Oleoguttula mirabilis]|uniref:HIG1 domain-containing protein n=1 Tax=Oleoguttula mirabilis TaxID=1507867 RepID=A0AAV9JP13_9PEZI|nr:hypothetical protein LTR36_001373 [Oleoguttula mirabilis]
MSVPGNINTAPPPSSFDNDSDFYEESRWTKLKRRITEEPLIPLGCDKHRTNRMFRRRIYAQGFTIFAMILGSAYWQGDRKKRDEFNELVEDKKKKEKHELWLRELEAREEEEQHLRKLRSRLIDNRVAEKQKLSEGEKRAVEAQTKEAVGQNNGGFGDVRSVLETSEQRSCGPILQAVRQLWECGRWYATLADEQSPRTYLGMEWQFVAPLTPADVGDDGEFTELPTSEDGLSDISSITDASDEDSTVDEDEAHEVGGAYIDNRCQCSSALRITRQDGVELGYIGATASWVGHSELFDYKEERHKPSVTDWLSARDAGVDLDAAMRLLVRKGRSTKMLRESRGIW